MLDGQAKKTYNSPRLSEMYWEKGSNITKKFSAGSPLKPRAGGRGEVTELGSLTSMVIMLIYP